MSRLSRLLLLSFILSRIQSNLALGLYIFNVFRSLLYFNPRESVGKKEGEKGTLS